MADKAKAKALIGNLGINRNTTSADIEEQSSTEKGCKTGEARTTVILNKDLVKKVKFIALAEGSSIKDKVAEGLNAIVETYEREHGKINI